MTYIYAIGDIHGRDNLLEKIYARIETDPYRPEKWGKPLVIHLGDYIDGGPDSQLVLDRIIKGSPHFDSLALLGNHEDLMLACLETRDRDVWWNWLSNGGNSTLKSLGLSTRFGYEPSALRDALGEQRINWLRHLPLYYETTEYIFVHAGIVPGVPLSQQHRKDMLWIRSRFLQSQVDHGKIIVHGHTQTIEPEVRPNRIGIDTGEMRPKTLTAIALCPGQSHRFLQVT